MIIHCHLVFKGLNDGGDISVLAMNKMLLEAQGPRPEYIEQMMCGSKYLLLHKVANVFIYTYPPWYGSYIAASDSILYNELSRNKIGSWWTGITILKSLAERAQQGEATLS